MYFRDLVKEASMGSGEKLTALMRLAGHSDLGSFTKLVNQQFADAAGIGAFAEQMSMSRTVCR